VRRRGHGDVGRRSAFAFHIIVETFFATNTSTWLSTGTVAGCAAALRLKIEGSLPLALTRLRISQYKFTRMDTKIDRLSWWGWNRKR
jgi:hypothetical protein